MPDSKRVLVRYGQTSYLINLDYLVSYRLDRCLGAVADRELLHDVADMGFYRVDADMQMVRYLLIREALYNQ